MTDHFHHCVWGERVCTMWGAITAVHCYTVLPPRALKVNEIQKLPLSKSRNSYLDLIIVTFAMNVGVFVSKVFFNKKQKKNSNYFLYFRVIISAQSKIKYCFLFNVPYNCVLLIRIVFLQTFTVIFYLCRLPIAIQSAVFEVPYVLYVLDDRTTCDVTDNERCSGSSERKIPRALATW